MQKDHNKHNNGTTYIVGAWGEEMIEVFSVIASSEEDAVTRVRRSIEERPLREKGELTLKARKLSEGVDGSPTLLIDFGG